jgi:peptidoglycan/LPS O-acetylase OafA/YrhL
VSAYRRILELEDTGSAWHYAGASVKRYIPALWPSIILIWVMTLVSPGLAPVPVASLPANLTMAADFVGTPLVDASHWRLKVEMLLAAGAGVVWYSFGRQYMAALLTVLLLIAASTATWAEPTRQAGLTLEGVLTLDGYLPHCVFGMALCQLVDYRETASSGMVSRGIWMMLALCSFVLAVLGNSREHQPVVTAFLIIVIGAMCGGLPSLARVPLLLWLGRISLPIYLIHQTPGFALIGSSEQLHCQPWLAIVAAFLLTISLGAAVERWAERPAEQLAIKLVSILAVFRERCRTLLSNGLIPIRRLLVGS